MASLREIRRKIKSVKSTQQITKAMKMVAAARLRKAQARILSSRPFAQKMEEMMRDVLLHIKDEQDHPLFAAREGSKRLLLVVTADKGLCGAFNTNLIRQAMQYLRQHGMNNVDVFVVGRKGRDAFRRMGASIQKEYVQIFNALSPTHAELITRDLIEAYLQGPYVTVEMIYNEFKSVVSQKVVIKPLLPLEAIHATEETEAAAVWPPYIYEPGQKDLMTELIPRFLRAQVFRVLLESNASELGARMSAMDSATRNAKELMEALTLKMNRTRQASITKEILEVVSGAEALK